MKSERELWLEKRVEELEREAKLQRASAEKHYAYGEAQKELAEAAEAKLARCVEALDAAAIALGNQAHASGSWHEDEMRMDAAREAGRAARAALAAAKGGE